MMSPSDVDSHDDSNSETISKDSDTLRIKLEQARKTPACLVMVFGSPLGKQFVLESEQTDIGRGSICQISINDKSISRSQARIWKDAAGAYFVKDLGSTNGSCLNDRQLQPDQPSSLKDGDFLKVGNIILKFVAAGSFDNVFHAEMLNIALIDDLTGIPNRKSILEALDEQFRLARMTDTPFSILLFDLDDFKSINDRFGHLAGDYVLKEIPKALTDVLRQQDYFGRFGGDEFLVLLKNTTLANACRIAERIRVAIQNHGFPYEEKKIPVSVSVGVASLDSSLQASTNLFQQADKAHYNAKESGGNKVCAC